MDRVTGGAMGDSMRRRLQRRNALHVCVCVCDNDKCRKQTGPFAVFTNNEFVCWKNGRSRARRGDAKAPPEPLPASLILAVKVLERRTSLTIVYRALAK